MKNCLVNKKVLDSQQLLAIRVVPNGSCSSFTIHQISCWQRELKKRTYKESVKRTTNSISRTKSSTGDVDIIVTVSTELRRIRQTRSDFVQHVFHSGAHANIHIDQSLGFVHICWHANHREVFRARKRHGQTHEGFFCSGRVPTFKLQLQQHHNVVNQ